MTRKRIHPLVVLALLAVVVTLLMLWVARINAQEVSVCDVPVSSVYVLQTNADASASAAALVNGWVLDESRWLERYGAPEYTLYVNPEAPEAERRYLFVYPSSADADSVVVLSYSHHRLFETFEVIGTLSDGSPDYLHYHPDCVSGAMPRANITTLLVEAVPRPTVAPPVPPSAEAMERERLRLLRVDAEIACARVEAWAVNHATDDGLADAQAACTAALDAVLAGGA